MKSSQKCFSVLLFCLTICHVLSQQESDVEEFIANKTDDKSGRVFSLFSIVTFKNTGCKSQSTMSSGQSTVRNGTCYTSSECTSKGGAASGNCAAGFGVCCLFLVSSSGAVINQNCTYLRNPGFPSAYAATSSLTFTINKCSSDVCFLRLDFETFTTLGPSTTVEQTVTSVGGSCPDQFKVTTNTGSLSSLTLGQSIPILCGVNTGQHIYVDMGTQSTDSATFSFTFSTTISSTTRAWEIKISQITCSNPNRPPNGCLQYFTTTQGRFTTFNFTPTTSTHLDTQLYTACFRRAAGFCCIQYQTCEGVPNSFTLDGTTLLVGAGMGGIDNLCLTDFITIPASSNSCSATAGKLVTKYCGNYLGLSAIANANSIVCDCSGSFQVGVRTDAIAESPSSISRGVCLDYFQVPCVTN